MNLECLEKEMKGVNLSDVKALIRRLQEYVRSEESKGTGYERNMYGGYYSIGSVDSNHVEGSLCVSGENRDIFKEQDYYKSANYFNDRHLAEDRARFFNLYNQLTRFKARNGIKENDLVDTSLDRYVISFDPQRKELIVDKLLTHKRFGSIDFSTKECTEKAIKQFEDELLWYFTEYKDRRVSL